MPDDAPMTDEALNRALRAALASIGYPRELRAVRREENVYVSSHHSEVVQCSFEEGDGLALLCKCGQSHDQDPWGLRRGIAYEARVYGTVLSGGLGTPRFYGSWEDRRRGITWMFLEYLGEGWQLDLGPETAVVDAAAMLGELHRVSERELKQCAGARLNHYDRRYLRTCLRFGRELAEHWRARVPGFDELTARFETQAELLASAPATLVHGECTPHNIVWAGERPYLVDWEEAAVGAGEIDIACLTDEWEEHLVALALEAYVTSRWPEGPPHDFARTLESARVYWLLRWLGYPEDDGEEETEWVLQRVNSALTSARGG